MKRKQDQESMVYFAIFKEKYIGNYVYVIKYRGCLN